MTKILLNRKLIKYRVTRVLGLLILAYTVALAAATYSSQDSREGGFILPFIVIPVAILGMFFIYREMGKMPLSIKIDDEFLQLPIFYFWVSRVPLASIVALEEFGLKIGAPTFSISLKNGASRHVDSSIFNSLDQFEMLRARLEEVAAQNRERNSWPVLEIEKSTVDMHLLQLFFVGIWIYLYYVIHLQDSANANRMLEIGALSMRAWTLEEGYRLSSWFFLHSSIFHLLINVLTFASLSTLLLRVMDFIRYLCLIFLSTLIASIYVLIVTPEVQVIGASAGIFGLFGAHCALKFNRYLPVSINAYSNQVIVFLILVSFVGELFASGISSASHLGGGLAGYALMRGILHCNPSNRIYESTLAEKGLAVFLSFAYAAGLLRFLWLAAHA